jgi:apolipoprotein D and lipocalin family protein
MTFKIFCYYIGFFFLSCRLAYAIEQETLQTVPHVDLQLYKGKWYEIARLRAPWELACAINTTYIYTLQLDGSLHVATQCQSQKAFHELEKAEGTLQVIDPKTNSKLKISFPYSSYKWIYSGDYWIIQLADDYSYAVVSEPTQKHVWILSRTPTIPSNTYQDILDKITLQLPAVNILDMMQTTQNQKTK